MNSNRYIEYDKFQFIESRFIKHSTSPNSRLSLIILLTVRVQKLIEIVE